MGGELLIGFALAFVVLGPKRMQLMLGHAGRAKARFDDMTNDLKSQWAAQIDKVPETAESTLPGVERQ
jgi:Sec-independent protein translocase protein TatA